MSTNKIDKFSILKDITIDDFFARNIYILGSAEYGPVNEPLLIKNELHLARIFGNSGTLIDSFSHILDTSQNSNVYCVKVTGEHSKAYLDVNVLGGSIEHEGLIFEAYEANEIYNNSKIEITSTSIKFVYPTEVAGSVEYEFSKYVYVGQLINAINNDTANGLNCVKAYTTVDFYTPLIGAIDVVNPSTVIFYGGDSGISYSKNLYYNKLSTTYDLLEGYDIDIIIPVDAFIDDMKPDYLANSTDSLLSVFFPDDRDYLDLLIDNSKVSFYNQLLAFCINQFNFGYITHGVIGFNRTYDNRLYKSEDEYIQKCVLASFQNNLIDVDNYNYAYLVSCTVGDVQYSDGKVDNSYLAYAGTMSEISLNLTTTNVSMGSNIKIFNEFNNKNLVTLTDNGFVVLRVSPLTKQVTVNNGVTTFPNTSDLHYLCNIRMIQFTMCLLNYQFNKLIGENIQPYIDDGTLLALLNKLMVYLNANGVLDEYNISFDYDTTNSMLIITLILKTIYMTETITANKTIQLDGEEDAKVQ